MPIFEYNYRSFSTRKGKLPEMRQFRGRKATLGIQLTGFAIRENCLRRRLRLHTTHLRLPLVRIWRPQIPGQIGADPFKRLTDIRENSLFHQLSTHPKVQ